jgi:chemotaxis protein CheX
MDITREDIERIVRDTWCFLIGLDVTPTAWDGAVCLEPEVIGCTRLTGAWTGMILVHCSTQLARLATSRIYGESLEAVTDAQIHDAIAELANVLGGNLKGLLPAPSRLRLPAVFRGEDLYRPVLETETLHAAFEAEGLPLHISVLPGVQVIPVLAQVSGMAK